VSVQPARPPVGAHPQPLGAGAASAGRVGPLLWRPAAIYLASRAGVLLVIAGISYIKHAPATVALLNWDGRWYLRVAEHGYPHAVPPGVGVPAQSNLAFFPVLPMLIRLAHLLTRLPFDDAGLLVTGLAGLAAAGTLWTLLYRTADRGAADRGTALVFFSPAAFVLSMVYTEPLIIAFAAGVFLALRRRRWVLAGVLAGLSTALDPLAVAIVVPCALAAWPALRRGRERRALAAPLLALCGVGGFAVYLWVHTGSPFAYLAAQRHGWQYGKIGAGIPLAFRYIVEHGLGNVDDTVKAISTVLVFVALVAYLRRRPDRARAGYVLAVLVLAAISPQVAWSPRVALRAFPLLAWVGGRLRDAWFPAALGLSALALATLTVISLSSSALPFTP
jgi:hypothetical protein